MHKYFLEFILNVKGVSSQVIRNSIIEFGEGLKIIAITQEATSSSGEDFKVCISTSDPTIVFDTCSSLGRLKSVKVSEDISYGA